MVLEQKFRQLKSLFTQKQITFIVFSKLSQSGLQWFTVVFIDSQVCIAGGRVCLGIDIRQVEISHQDLIAGCPPILS